MAPWESTLCEAASASRTPTAPARSPPPAPPGAADGRICVPARVTLRAYLGEAWDDQIVIDGLADPLRVTARPQAVFEVGDSVTAEIDLTQVTVIESER